MVKHAVSISSTRHIPFTRAPSGNPPARRNVLRTYANCIHEEFLAVHSTFINGVNCKTLIRNLLLKRRRNHHLYFIIHSSSLCSTSYERTHRLACSYRGPPAEGRTPRQLHHPPLASAAPLSFLASPSSALHNYTRSPSAYCNDHRHTVVAHLSISYDFARGSEFYPGALARHRFCSRFFGRGPLDAGGRLLLEHFLNCDRTGFLRARQTWVSNPTWSKRVVELHQRWPILSTLRG